MGTHCVIGYFLTTIQFRDFFLWVKSLSEYSGFRDCISLSERQMDESFDIELVSRYLVFTMCDDGVLGSIDELGSFLTDNMVEHAKNNSFDTDAVGSSFKRVFDYLSQTLGDNSFKKFDLVKDKYLGATLISVFEVVASGLGYAVLEGFSLPDPEEFKRLHKNILDNPDIIRAIKPGVRASTRLPQTVKYGRGLFANES